MTPNRLTVRCTPADAANLEAVADTLRANRGTTFITITDAVTAALAAAAVLAREGALAGVLAASRGQPSGPLATAEDLPQGLCGTCKGTTRPIVPVGILPAPLVVAAALSFPAALMFPAAGFLSAALLRPTAIMAAMAPVVVIPVTSIGLLTAPMAAFVLPRVRLGGRHGTREHRRDAAE